MQVVEKNQSGLSRSYEVVVPAATLAERLNAKIAEVTPRIKINGFRPGKVPAGHIRKLYGRDLMGEVIQDALNETSKKALDDAKLRPASQPELKPINDFEAVVAGKADLAYELLVELMPEFTPADVSTFTLQRPVYLATDAEVEEALTKLAAGQKTYADKKGGKKAVADDGDQVIADFVGKIDGETFEGGSAEGAEIVIGSGQFIPGFEDGVKGAKVGETRTITVTFPEDYGAKHLAGKPAEFEITVTAIKSATETALDDEFAKRFGFEALDALKEALKAQAQREFDGASRFKLKRALLDALDSAHSFELPARMLDAEFEGIWRQIEQDKATDALSEEDKGKTDDELKAEYRAIAARRVRLGLVLAEIGRERGVTVSDNEVAQAISAEARRYPGQENEVFNFYRQNPNAIASIRAPLFEEKVCELLFTIAKVEDVPTTKDDLLSDVE